MAKAKAKKNTLLRVSVILFLLYVVISLVQIQGSIQKDREQLAALAQQNAAQRSAYKELERILSDGTEEEYIERIAREQLGFAYPEEQVLVERFSTETRAMMRKSAHQETAQPVPCQMINCFCMYSDYTPLTLEEWVECDQRRRDKADR